MSPTLSIITVTYNASEWLERTVRNVLNQSYPHIEYLIIDGGSADGTVGIIERYASRIAYWVSEPDRGLYDAMNKGLLKASGDYVWFVNAGDTLHSTDTAQQVADSLAGREELPDVVYGETRIVDAGGRSLGMRRLKAPEKLTWKSFRMGMLVCHQSFLVKRELAPLYDTGYRWVADYDWCIACLKKAGSIHNTSLILCDFLEAGLSSVHRKASLRERYRVMKKYYGAVPTLLMHGWFAVRFYSAKWIQGNV
jgi:glycosyltransferase involved in cell wall biosynthesis